MADNPLESEHFFDDYGRYIIEIVLSERTPGSHAYEYHGFVRFWLKRGRLPGKNDEQLYVHGIPSCSGLLTAEDCSRVLCPHCGLPLKGEIGEIWPFKCPLEQLAAQVATFWNNLEHNASLRLVRTTVPYELQAAATRPTTDHKLKMKASEEVQKGLETAIYIKEKLEKDVATGGSLIRRIKAFLDA